MNNQAAQTMPKLPKSDHWGFEEQSWLYTDDQMHQYARDYAAALSQTAGVPDGWKLVPVEPTDAMIDAAWECDSATDYVGEHKRIHSAADAYQAMLAAAPAASGVHPDALPDGTLSKSTAKRVEALAAASVSERARELLAAEYSKCGMQQCAADIRSGVFAAAQQLAVNAIKAALEQSVPNGEVAIVCDWKGADPFPAFIEAEVGGKSVSLAWRDRPDGLKELIVPVTASALRAIEQALTQQRGEAEPVAFVFHELTGEVRLVWYSQSAMHNPPPSGTKLYTTPKPSADAVRAIGWLNSDGSSYLPTEKRARMIEAGKCEGASVGEVTFGKIAEDHRIALYAAPPSVAGLVTAWRDRINVDPEDPYEHGESDTLMSCADELESLLSAASGEGVGK